MDRPTFSQSWSRVSRLTPKLRPHVQITRQLYRGEPWHVVHDPVSNNFFRLPPVGYHFVSLLDGKRSVDDAWRLTLDRFGDGALTQNEVIGLLGNLNQSNLLRVDLPPDAAPLLERHTKRRVKHWAGQAMSILFMRIPIFNPDQMLTWLLPLFKPILNKFGMIAWVLWIIYCLVSFMPYMRAFLTDAGSVLAPSNWGWMIVLFLITKALHELGHGLVCKRFGGVVPQVGIMLLVLFPAPFVDATSSWNFPDRWKRILVGAAGMIFELALAGGAALVWIRASSGEPFLFFTDADLVRQLAYNIVFLASITTILFNANPLLRFDGYYMLSDLLEIPNLYERSTRHLKWLIQIYAYGMDGVTPVSSSRAERMLLTSYGIASQIYRVLVLTGIILFIAGQLATLGILLALWSFIAWLIIPTGKFVRWMASNPALVDHRARAVTVTVMFAVVLLVIIGVIPMKDHRRAEGVIESGTRADVVMLTDGFVNEVKVRNGDRVDAGQVILIADNPALRARRKELDARLAMLVLARRHALAENDTNAKRAAQAQIDAVREEVDRITERIDDLVLKSSQAGTIVSYGLSHVQGRFLQRGQVVARVMDLSDLRVTAMVSQQQNAAPFFLEIEQVELRTVGDRTRVLPSSVEKPFVAGRNQLPHAALGYAGGGTIPIDTTDESGTKTLRPLFEIWLRLPAERPDVYSLLGQRVYVRFTLAKRRPLLFQWIHKGRQIFRDRIKGNIS